MHFDLGTLIHPVKSLRPTSSLVHIVKSLHPTLLRSAVAGRIYKLCAKHTSNSGFERTIMPCSSYFYALPNNERGTKYRGLTYSAKQTVLEICRATYSASQTRLRINLTVSITVVQSIETPQTTQKHPKPPKTPQASIKPKPLPYILVISYNA